MKRNTKIFSGIGIFVLIAIVIGTVYWYKHQNKVKLFGSSGGYDCNEICGESCVKTHPYENHPATFYEPCRSNCIADCAKNQ
jgi:hypothetical protein